MQKYQQHLDWLIPQAMAMEETLVKWSKINSGSYNLSGLADMLAAIRKEFAVLDAETEVIELKPEKIIAANAKVETVCLGKALRLRKRPQAPLQIFLCGHMDTVFDEMHQFQTVTKKPDNVLVGPGVTDMKGGLLVMLYALQAFERSDLTDQLGWEIIINPDEEIGSPGSAPLFAEAAKRHALGFDFEPAITPEGDIVGQRKGSGKFSIVIRGKAAHAGRSFHKGRNAITALAKIITAIDNLNTQREGVTLNVGRVEGGGALNIVPELALCHIDVRIKHEDDTLWTMEQLNALIADANTHHEISAELHGGFGRMPKNVDASIKQLIDFVIDTGRALGLQIHCKSSGGVCDGNNLAAAGLPNVDTLGVRGGNIHSDQEYIFLDSLVERAQLSALILMKLANKEFLP